MEPESLQNRDKRWWERTHESSFNSRYLENEYTNSFMQDESVHMEAESDEDPNCTFPLPLNPKFDLQALIMVRNTLNSSTVVTNFYSTEQAFAELSTMIEHLCEFKM